MYPDGINGIFGALIAILFIWMGIISYLVWQNRQLLKRLFPAGQGDFSAKLEEVLKEIEGLQEFKVRNLENIQKVALKRYNPYQDTGGDQSFTVTLLDGKGDGVVITSLHSRVGTRVFAKPVKGGKEDRFNFSAEEKDVVNQAMSAK